MSRLLAWALEDAGYAVDTVYDGNALQLQMTPQIFGGVPERYALVISDIRMPGLSGLEFLRSVREAERKLPIILITSFGDRRTHDEAARLGALVLDKPFELDLLLDAVGRLLPDSGDHQSQGRLDPAPLNETET